MCFEDQSLANSNFLTRDGLEELDGVAPLVAKDPARSNSTTRKNPPICNTPLYVALTFKQIMQL